MKTSTSNRVIAPLSHDVESGTSEMPLYPASTWLKNEFKRAISVEERSFLLLRIWKYFMLYRAALNPDFITLLFLVPCITNPPDNIDGLPVNSKVLFPFFFVIKLVTAIILVFSFVMFTRSQRLTEIPRILSLKMLDHMKITDAVTMIASITIFITMIWDIVLLLWLQCSTTTCNSAVFNLYCCLILNLIFAIPFPFIYWQFLVWKNAINRP